MISARAQRQTPVLSPLTQGGILPTRRTTFPPRREPGNGEAYHDPARLSAALRELALRAHRAVRAVDHSGSSPGAVVDPASDSGRELSEVHARILQLQRSLRAQSLGGLTEYVAALRQRVESVITGH